MYPAALKWRSISADAAGMQVTEQRNSSSLHATAELSTQGALDACQNLRAISLRYRAAN